MAEVESASSAVAMAVVAVTAMHVMQTLRRSLVSLVNTKGLMKLANWVLPPQFQLRNRRTYSNPVLSRKGYTTYPGTDIFQYPGCVYCIPDVFFADSMRLTLPPKVSDLPLVGKTGGTPKWWGCIATCSSWAARNNAAQ